MATNKKANDQAPEKGQDKVYDLDSLPTDFVVDATQKSFEPLKAGAYQMQVDKVELKDNIFWKPLTDEGKPSNPATKYTISVTLVALEEGTDYGRRIWDNFSPIVKPTGTKGPSKAYKFITSVLKSELNWDDCEAFAADPKTFFTNMKSLEGNQVNVMLEVAANEKGTKKNKVASYFEIKKALPPYEAKVSE